MIISNQQVQAILRLYEAAKAKAPADTGLPETPQKTKGEQAGDRAELSDKAQLFQKACEVAFNAPEVRKDLVEQIKKKIDEGSYSPEPEKIAEKILNRFLVDKIV